MSVSGVEDRSPGTITGRSRGNGLGSAAPTELGTSRKAVTHSKRTDMFRRVPIVRRPSLMQK